MIIVIGRGGSGGGRIAVTGGGGGDMGALLCSTQEYIGRLIDWWDAAKYTARSCSQMMMMMMMMMVGGKEGEGKTLGQGRLMDRSK